MHPNPQPKKEEDPVPPFNYSIVETIKLRSPVRLDPVNFWELIQERRSRKSFQQVTLDNVNQILWQSAKVKNVFVQENGYILTERPSPSAGARHPIDILVLSDHFGERNQLSYYNPFDHSLNILAIPETTVNSFAEHVGSIINISRGTIIWFVAHPIRTTAKYNEATSLIWRDAGALLQIIQLVCTATGLNSCPVGSLGEPFISEMFSSEGFVFGAGGIIIG